MTEQMVLLGVFMGVGVVSWWIAQLGSLGLCGRTAGSGSSPENGLPGPVLLLASFSLRPANCIWPGFEKRLADTIAAAGCSAQLNVRELAGSQMMAGLGAAGVWAAIAFLGNAGISGWAGGLAIAFFAGWTGPFIRLHDKARKRRRLILREMPFALDLMAASMQAGYDFNAAVAVYIEKGGKGPLCDELALMASEMRLGKSRREALLGAAARTGLAEMRSVISSIVQGSEMGTGIAEILEVQSDTLRQKWFSHAEKRAARAPAKMIFPLALFVVPATMIVIAVPIAVRLLGVYGR